MRRRALMAKRGRLPSEYQEVEWIMGSGRQYFYIDDTKALANNDVIEFDVTRTKDVAGVVLGNSNNSQIYPVVETEKWTQYNVGSRIRFTLADNYDSYINVRNHIVVNVSITDSSWHKLSVLCANNARYICDGFELHSFKVKRGLNYYRNLIPCYRVSDNEIGMYDLVNDVFYTNQGTGTFTKGADVL